MASYYQQPDGTDEALAIDQGPQHNMYGALGYDGIPLSGHQTIMSRQDLITTTGSPSIPFPPPDSDSLAGPNEVGVQSAAFGQDEGMTSQGPGMSQDPYNAQGSAQPVQTGYPSHPTRNDIESEPEPDTGVHSPLPDFTMTQWQVQGYPTTRPRSRIQSAKPYDPVPARRATVEGSIRNVARTPILAPQSSSFDGQGYGGESHIQAGTPLRPATVAGVVPVHQAHPTLRTPLQAFVEEQNRTRRLEVFKANWTVTLFIGLSYLMRVFLPPDLEHPTPEFTNILTHAFSRMMQRFGGWPVLSSQALETLVAQSWPPVVQGMIVASETAQQYFRDLVKKEIFAGKSKEQILALPIMSMIRNREHCHDPDQGYRGYVAHFNHGLVYKFLKWYFFSTYHSLGFVAASDFNEFFSEWVIGWGFMVFGVSLLDYSTGEFIAVPVLPYWRALLPGYLQEIEQAVSVPAIEAELRQRGGEMWKEGRDEAKAILGPPTYRDYLPRPFRPSTFPILEAA